LAVARVMVGAQDAELGIARGHAALELLEAARIDVAEGLHVAHRFLLSLSTEQRHRADPNRRRRALQAHAYRSATCRVVRARQEPRQRRRTRARRRART